MEIVETCLDQVITNCAEKMSKPEVFGVGKSDHLGVYITKFSREVRTSPRTVKKRTYKEFNKEKFKEDIVAAKNSGAFDDVHKVKDVDEAINIFTKVYNSILNIHAPIKIIQNRTNYVPYVSNDIKTLMGERDQQKILAAGSGKTEDFNKYKRLRNKVVSMMRGAELKYYQEKFNDPSMSSGDAWKNAYQILGSSKSSFPSQIIINNKLFSKPIEMATEMNQFFLNKIQKLKSENEKDIDYDEATEELLEFLSTKQNNSNFTLKELNDIEVKELLKTITGKKSLGLDWICSYSLKMVAAELLPELKAIINLSIRTGKFGTEWKNSKVLPGWKNKGSRSDSKFYRPISNLSELSKLCERAVHNQFYNFLMEKNLIHPLWLP